jgi:hypothetical protein
MATLPITNRFAGITTLPELGAALQEIRQRGELFLINKAKVIEADRIVEEVHQRYMATVVVAKELCRKRDIAADLMQEDIMTEENECRGRIRVVALEDLARRNVDVPRRNAILSAQRGKGSGDPTPPAQPAAEEESDDESWGNWGPNGVKQDAIKSKPSEGDTGPRPSRILVIKNVAGMGAKELKAHIRTLMNIRTDWGEPDTTAAISFNYERQTAFVRFDTQEECELAEKRLEGARNTKTKSKGKGKMLKVENGPSTTRPPRQRQEKRRRGRDRGENEAADGKQACQGRQPQARTMEFQNGRKEKHHEGAHTEQTGGPRCRGKQPIGQQLHLLKKTKNGGQKRSEIWSHKDGHGRQRRHGRSHHDQKHGKGQEKQVER